MRGNVVHKVTLTPHNAALLHHKAALFQYNVRLLADVKVIKVARMCVKSPVPPLATSVHERRVTVGLGLARLSTGS